MSTDTNDSHNTDDRDYPWVIVTSDNRDGVRKLLRSLPDSDSRAIGKMTLAELAEELEGCINENALTEDDVRGALIPSGNGRANPDATDRPERQRFERHRAAPPEFKGDATEALAALRKLLAGSVDESQVRSIVAEAVAKQAMTPKETSVLVKSILEEKLSAFIQKAERQMADMKPQYKGIEISIDGGEKRQIEGVTHPVLPDVIAALATGEHVWLAGPAGSGKSTLAKQAAEALGKKLYYTGAVSSKYDLIGFAPATGEKGSYTLRTPMREAYEHGGVFVWDDIDGSDPRALVAFLGCLDGHDGFHFPDGYVAKHPDFICVGTANTWGTGATAEYVGRAKLDGAFLGRFPNKIMVDYNRTFEECLYGSEVVATVFKVRGALASLQIKHAVTPRHTRAFAKLLAVNMPRQRAAEVSLFGGLTTDQIKQVRNNVGDGL